MGRKKSLPLFAMIVLLIAISASLYVHAFQVSPDTTNQQYAIVIDETMYTINELSLLGSERTITIDEGEETGLALDSIIQATNLQDPKLYSYVIKAIDGYQQTVRWEDMQQGILTLSARVMFPHLAHVFWVRDVISIEVVKNQ